MRQWKGWYDVKREDHRGEAFLRIKAGLENAIAHAEGRKRLTVREVELPDPPRPMTPAQIAGLRTKVFKVSQHVFARMVNASPQTVQAWEQGKARPTGPTLRFLRVIEKHPDIVSELVA